MRRLHREWSDKKPFIRRCRWYADADDFTKNIRISYCDDEGQMDQYYQDNGNTAIEDWKNFIYGKLTTKKLRARV